MLHWLRRLIPTVVRRSYALKFGILLLVIGASVGAVGLLATEAIGAEVQENTNDEYATLAEQEAQSLQGWSESNEQRVRTLVRNPDLRSLGTTDLRQYTQSPDRARAIHIIDQNDNSITASTDRELVGESVDVLSVPDTDQRLTELEPFSVYTSEPYRLEDGEGTPVVTYGQATEDGAIGVVYTVELEQYAENFNSYGNDRSTTLVVDSQSRVAFDDAGFRDQRQHILQSYNGNVLESQSRTVGARTVAASDSAGVLSAYDFPDEEYVVGYAPVDGTDWVVLVHEPTADAYGFVATVQRFGLGATGAGVLLITVMGAVIGRSTAVSINQLTERAERMESGDLDVDLETTRIDEIGQLYDGFANMRDALREQISEAQAARSQAESERERVERINDDLQQSAEEYCAVMGAAADGNLSVRADVDTENDQMRGIGEDFNEMLGEIEVTVADLKQFAEQVAVASEQATASSEEVRSASEQVTESIQEISDGAEQQNNSLQSVSQEMGGLSTTTEEIAASSNEVADIAERTARTGREGREAAQEAIEGMSSIERGSQNAVEEIEALQEEVSQIDELLEFITEVAEQTNMLALNANIEASRSSESGDGFAVVAEEVKELAAETKDAAEDIEDRLERVKSQTDETALEVQRTSDEITNHTDSVRDAANALDEIADYTQETNTGVQEISAATEQQAASTQEVVAMVDEAATISEETTAEAENVAAAAEQQTTALTEVSHSVSDLANQASQLSEALDRFDADGDAEPGGPIDVL
jgi:methyl-accepting chemotaxis protein